jgi:hypothetical protein
MATDVAETISTDLFERGLRYQGVDDWEHFLVLLEGAMAPAQSLTSTVAATEQATRAKAEARAAVNGRLPAGSYTPLPQAGTGEVEPWLKSVIERALIDRWRKETKHLRPRGRLRLSIHPSMDNEAPGPQFESETRHAEDGLITAETVDRLLAVMEVLPVDQRFSIRFGLLMVTESWTLWQRIPEGLRFLSTADRSVLGLSPTEEFPPREFFDLAPQPRQRVMENRLIDADRDIRGENASSADPAEKRIKERVQKWKTRGLEYLRAVVAKDRQQKEHP